MLSTHAQQTSNDSDRDLRPGLPRPRQLVQNFDAPTVLGLGSTSEAGRTGISSLRLELELELELVTCPTRRLPGPSFLATQSRCQNLKVAVHFKT
jgi:hypothetical protein